MKALRTRSALLFALLSVALPLNAVPVGVQPKSRPSSGLPAGERVAMAFANGTFLATTANGVALATVLAPPPYVGLIACLDPYRRGVRHVATGWLVGASDTVITVAHAFYKDEGGGLMQARRLDPARCIFSLSDPSGHVWDIINIRYAVSEWANGRRDQSSDVAVVKLDRPPVRAVALPRLAPLHQLETGVRLVAFHMAGADSDRPIVTLGQIHSFPHKKTCSTGFCVHIRSRMFISCAASSAGSSGGLYLDGQGAAVGLHIGYYCGAADSVFSQTSCFNYGIFLDGRIRWMIASVNADTVDPGQLVR